MGVGCRGEVNLFQGVVTWELGDVARRICCLGLSAGLHFISLVRSVS